MIWWQKALCLLGKHDMKEVTSRLLSGDNGYPNGVFYGSMCACCRSVRFTEITRPSTNAGNG